MSDLISREAACLAIHNYQTEMGWANGLHEMDIHKVLLKLPAVDAEPVRHGKWRYKKQYVAGGKGQTFSVWQCSCCRKKERRRTDYCPNCGAKMDEEV